MTSTTIQTDDGHLHVERSGPESAPLVLLVHGFPDSHVVWDGVAERLAADHHVVRYDVRGAGGSSAPADRSGYRMSCLVSDLAAVLEEVAPDGRPVHLVGHDWGSIQGWGALGREPQDARLTGRIASFTTISGPGLDQYGHFVRTGLRRGRVLTVGRQLASSWYAMAFQLPRVPELVLTRLGGPIGNLLAAREGLDRAEGGRHWAVGLGRDAVNGVNLYRANGLRFVREPTPTDVPVQLVVPTKDAFLSPALYADLEAFAPDLRRMEVVAGHWVVRTQPDVVADAVRSFVADVEARSGQGTAAVR